METIIMRNSNWIKTEIISTDDKSITVELKLKYIPLFMIVDLLKQLIGWRLWLYPRVIKYIVNNWGITPESL